MSVMLFAFDPMLRPVFAVDSDESIQYWVKKYMDRQCYGLLEMTEFVADADSWLQASLTCDADAIVTMKGFGYDKPECRIRIRRRDGFECVWWMKWFLIEDKESGEDFSPGIDLLTDSICVVDCGGFFCSDPVTVPLTVMKAMISSRYNGKSAPNPTLAVALPLLMEPRNQDFPHMSFPGKS